MKKKLNLSDEHSPPSTHVEVETRTKTSFLRLKFHSTSTMKLRLCRVVKDSTNNSLVAEREEPEGSERNGFVAAALEIVFMKAKPSLRAS